MWASSVLKSLAGGPRPARLRRHPARSRRPGGRLRLEALEVRANPGAGALDPTFGGDGKMTTDFGSSNDIGQGVAIQADGKMVVAGFSQSGTNTDFALARYNPDGSLDTTFGTGGKVTTDFGSTADFAYGVAIQADGKIVAAGNSVDASNHSRFALARYNPDGSLDTSFGSGGEVTTDVGVLTSEYGVARAVAIESDGTIVAGGFASGSSHACFALAEYNPDGSPKTSLGGVGWILTDFGNESEGYGLAIQADGMVVEGGSFYNGTNTNFALARYNADGSLDTGFDGDGLLTTPVGTTNSGALSVAIQANGKIVAGGYTRDTSNYTGFALARYNTDGSLDTSFGGTGTVTTSIGSTNDPATDVAVQADGKIVAGGYSSPDINTVVFALARYNPDGSLDPGFGGAGTVTTAFGAAADDAAAAIAIQADGKIVAAGSSFNGHDNDFGLVRYNPDGSLDPLADGTGKVMTPIGSSNASALATALQADGKIVTAGYADVGGRDEFALARYNPDGSLDPTFDGDGILTTAVGNSNEAWGVAIQTDGKIVAAGYSIASGKYDFALARYNPDGSLDTTFGTAGTVTTDFGSSNDSANGVAILPDGRIVAAGSSNAGGNDDFAIARYNPDGSLDTTFNGTGKVTTDFNGGNDIARGLAVQSDGKVVLTGYADNGPVAKFALARYNPDGSLDAGFGTGGKVTTLIGTAPDYSYSVAIQADGKIVAAGEQLYNLSFYEFALARYNPDGSLDSSFGSGGEVTTAFGTMNDAALGVAVQSDGKIVAAGVTFNGTDDDVALARYDADGTLDSTFGDSGKVTTPVGPSENGAIGLAIQPDHKIVAAGWASDGTRSNFAVVRVLGDAVVPSVTINQAADQPDPTATSPVTFNVIFSGPVTGFDAADVDLSASTVGGTLVPTVTGSGGHYTVTVTGMNGHGTVVASIRAGAAQFGSGAATPASTSTDNTVTFDNVPPTVTVNQDSVLVPPQADPTNVSPIVFDVQFSEPVVGFDTSKVTLGGTLSGVASVQSVSQVGTSNLYLVAVAISGSHTGTITASVAAGAVNDLAGNGNTASTSTDNTVTFDNQPQTVTVTPDTTSNLTVGGTSVAFDVLFSEPVVGFNMVNVATELDLTGTTAAGATPTITGSGPDYTVTFTGMTGGGLIDLKVNANAVNDLAGNGNVVSNAGGVNYVHSGTLQFSAPTYAINEQGAPTLQVVVTRTGGDVGPLTVDYAAADGTAHLGVDYGSPSGSGTLSWVDGDTTSRTISIPILDDGVLENDPTFTLNLSNVSLPGALGSPKTATVTIYEEAGLTLAGTTFGPFAQAGGTGTADVVVQRLFDSHGTVTVHYSTADGVDLNKAVAGRDYTAVSGTLTWADGDNAPQTIHVPLLDDGKSHGVEDFALTLDSAGGNALLGGTTTATVRIDKNHGVTIPGVLPTGQKPPAPFTDADGDTVAVRLGGRVAGSSLTYYLTDGVGPLSEIDLAGTDPTKSTVSIKVVKPKGGTGDGRVGIGEVDGAGFRSFTAKTGDLNGLGFNLSGFAGSIKVGNVSNGADFLLPGAVPAATPRSATRIVAGVIGDGTDITVAASLGNLTAIAVGDGTITAPSVGTIHVKGQIATKTRPLISGDFHSDVTISGAGVDPVKGKALKGLIVAGNVTKAIIHVGGNVGLVNVGGFVGSDLFAGYTGSTDGTGNFAGAYTVGPFVVRGATNAFTDSYVVATSFKNVILASVDTTDEAAPGTPFGFVFRGSTGGTFGGLTAKVPKLTYNKLLGGTQLLDHDFEVAKV